MSDVNPALQGTDTVDLQNQQQTIELVWSFPSWDSGRCLDNLTRLRPTRREQFRVTIFGSARVNRDHWVYGAVRDLARELTDMGCTIVTGGGPGLMQAANEGAALAAPGRQGSVGSGSICRSNRTSTRLSAAPSNTRRSSRACTTSCSSPTPLSSSPAASVRCWSYDGVAATAGTQALEHAVDPGWRDVAGLIDWHRQVMLRPEFELVSEQDLWISQVVPGATEALSILREHHTAWRSAGGTTR